MTFEDIRHFSEDGLLNMDYFLNESATFDDVFGGESFCLFLDTEAISFLTSDRLRIHYSLGYFYKGINAECRFCNLPPMRSDLPLDNVYEIMKVMILFCIKAG